MNTIKKDFFEKKLFLVFFAILRDCISKKPWFFAFLSYLLIYRSCWRDKGVVGLLESCTIRIKKIQSLKVAENKKFRWFLQKIDQFLKNSHLFAGCTKWADFLNTTIFDSEESESGRVFDQKNFTAVLVMRLFRLKYTMGMGQKNFKTWKFSRIRISRIQKR